MALLAGVIVATMFAVWPTGTSATVRGFEGHRPSRVGGVALSATPSSGGGAGVDDHDG